MQSIIVRRSDYEQYDRLYRAFGDRVPVVWDRRRCASRSAPTDHGAHAPREDRRHGLPPSWRALGFAVVDRSTA